MLQVIPLMIEAQTLLNFNSFWVAYPHICHAILFCTRLIVDATDDNPLLNLKDGNIWCQVQVLECDDVHAQRREYAMNNPSLFLSSQTFWLMKKPVFSAPQLNEFARCGKIKYIDISIVTS